MREQLIAGLLGEGLKSLTEPGSVARTRSTCPLPSSAKAFLARRMGSGQLRPRTSKSLSKAVIVPRVRSKRGNYIPNRITDEAARAVFPRRPDVRRKLS